MQNQLEDDGSDDDDDEHLMPGLQEPHLAVVNAPPLSPCHLTLRLDPVPGRCQRHGVNIWPGLVMWRQPIDFLVAACMCEHGVLLPFRPNSLLKA